MNKLYHEDQRWYRGNLHTHTTVSDGQMGLEEIVKHYKQVGYGFICVTDHETFYAGHEEDNFTVLSGIEIGVPNNSFRAWHITAIGMSDMPLLDDAEILPIIKRIWDTNGLPVICHPYWSLLSSDDLCYTRSAFATEIYSGVSERTTGTGDSSALVDMAMARGFAANLLGVDDTHRTQDLYQASVMLQSPSLKTEDLISALRSGYFYATNGGPGFKQITVEDDIIHVDCEGAAKIVFHTDAVWASNRVQTAKKDGVLTEANYQVNANERRVRIALWNERGQQSSSQIIDMQRYR